MHSLFFYCWLIKLYWPRMTKPQITISKVLYFSRGFTIVIILLMLSVWVCEKMITLRGLQCTLGFNVQSFELVFLEIDFFLFQIFFSIILLLLKKCPSSGLRLMKGKDPIMISLQTFLIGRTHVTSFNLSQRNSSVQMKKMSIHCTVQVMVLIEWKGFVSFHFTNNNKD